MIVDWLKSVSL